MLTPQRVPKPPGCNYHYQKGYNLNMLPKQYRQAIVSLPSLAGYFAIVSVAVMTILSLDSGFQRTLGLALFVLFAIVFTLAIIHKETSSLTSHIYIAIMAAIVIALMTIHPLWSAVPILFLCSALS